MSNQLFSDVSLGYQILHHLLQFDNLKKQRQ